MLPKSDEGARATSTGLIKEKGLADVLDLRYRALEIESLGQHNFEDLE